LGVFQLADCFRAWLNCYYFDIVVFQALRLPAISGETLLYRIVGKQQYFPAFPADLFLAEKQFEGVCHHFMLSFL